ncbi:MAG: hypothetical protein AB1690_02560 [Candidatus Zixiibacteriota bacterium]
MNWQIGFPKEKYADPWLWKNFWKHWALYLITWRPGQYLLEFTVLIFRFRVLFGEAKTYDVSECLTGWYRLAIEFYTIDNLVTLCLNIPLGKWRKKRSRVAFMQMGSNNA